ncbi:MAG: cobalt transporter CbiM [Gammaproteobacteria bacterium]|nr:cobalt transporter CbiM [Gammaproteobacteria bacterium]
MHISDGVLSPAVLGIGFGTTALLAAATLRKVDMEEIPKIAVITAVFFVANLIHIPLGATSVHLILNGLVGIILGWRAFPAIMLAVVLHAMLGHGGVSVIGVNSTMLGGGALLAAGIWQLRRLVKFPNSEIVFGSLAGAAGIFFSGCILALALLTTGEEFMGTAKLVLGYHAMLMVVEGAVAGACVSFLLRVRPEILGETMKQRAG